MGGQCSKAYSIITYLTLNSQRLSDLAIKHCMAAGLHSSSERILGDLAALK